MSHFNIRSEACITKEKIDKPTVLQEFISDKKLHILTLSETWLFSDTPSSVLQSLTPKNFSFYHVPRPSGLLGGGLAIIFQSYLKMTKISLPTFSSFESICASFSVPNNSFPSFY